MRHTSLGQHLDGRIDQRRIASYIAVARSSPRLNEMFEAFGQIARGTAGQPHSQPSLDSALFEYDMESLHYAYFRQKYAGPFNRHFIASVPYALEEQCRLGAALLAHCASRSAVAAVYTLGDGPGVTARTLTRMSGGQIRTLTCSPNPENNLEFQKDRPEGAYFFEGPFFELTNEQREELGSGVFRDRFDVIVEDTTFQMYGKERIEPIALAVRHLKSDGILILMEKLAQEDGSEFSRRERQKDRDFKSRYFSQDAIIDKQLAIVSKMNSQLVTLRKLTEAVSLFFTHSVVTWNSGNFYTVAASNCAPRLRRFVETLIAPAVPPEFLYAKLPWNVSSSILATPGNATYRFRRARK